MSSPDTPPYIALARKWRPSQFSDLVGQTHIVRTLMNAVKTGRIHHAYLLTGSRGIGKTSIARIFAKALRCPNVQWANDILRSCDTCASCLEIGRGNSVDVMEIDGASNNGVDAIREIRENARFLPSSGTKKIYIIDEVHMLTTAAFNALLKTLEEPPAHVLFVFATTEPHKIPATILSRCQRFDLRKVTSSQIQGRIQLVLAEEKVPAEPAALALIARAAEGGMRDALSLLDQVLAYSGQNITLQSVRESIGLIESQTLFGILQGVFSREVKRSLELVQQAYQQGHDLRLLTRGLLELLHAAILSKVVDVRPEGLEYSEDEWRAIQDLAATRDIAEIELIFQAFHQSLEWIARSPQPRIVLDILLIKCATAEALVSIQASDGPPGSGSSGPQNSGGHRSPSPSAPVSPASVSAHLSSVTSVTSTPVGTLSTPPPSQAPLTFAERLAGASATPAVSITPQQEVVSVATAAVSNANRSWTWESWIAHVKKVRPFLASVLEHGSCESLSADAIQLSFLPENSSYRDQLQSRQYTEQLQALTKEYFGKSVPVLIAIKEDAAETVASRREREAEARELQARNAVHNHPIITEARSLFGGELGPIEFTSNEGRDRHVVA